MTHSLLEWEQIQYRHERQYQTITVISFITTRYNVIQIINMYLENYSDDEHNGA